MTEQQQKLYDKLLKKVNEYCLGAAAEDVIEAIDALVESYETPKVPSSTPSKALDSIIETFIDKDSEDIKTVRTALKALDILKIYLEPKLFQNGKPCLGITVGQFHASYEIGKSEWYILKEVFE